MGQARTQLAISEPARGTGEQGLLDTPENCNSVRIKMPLWPCDVILFICISSVSNMVEIVTGSMKHACVSVCRHEHHCLMNVPGNFARLAVSLSLTSLLMAKAQSVQLLWLCRASGSGQNISGILNFFHNSPEYQSV